MCKNILVLLFFCFLINSVDAQSFKKGDNIISVGYGFGNQMKSATYAINPKLSFNPNESINLEFKGPYSLKFERAISNKIGLGFSLNYIQMIASYNYTIDSKEIINESNTYTSYSVLARFNYHFSKSKRFDPYLGAGIGYKTFSNVTESSRSDGASSGIVFKDFSVPVEVELGIGLRYYVIPHLAIYSELGLSKAFIQLGLSGSF